MNSKKESYDEDRLISFLNHLPNNDDPINRILDAIGEFSKDKEQTDDLTLRYLEIPNSQRKDNL